MTSRPRRRSPEAGQEPAADAAARARDERERIQRNSDTIKRQLASLATELEAAARSHEELGEVRHLWYPQLLDHLAEVQGSLGPIIRDVAVRGILEGAITQREASRRIGVHEHTVARWRREAEGS